MTLHAVSLSTEEPSPYKNQTRRYFEPLEPHKVWRVDVASLRAQSPAVSLCRYNLCPV